ncbi:hypothetical protein DPMN_079726 [Dreissena polymorpha]|uniref:Uncharacterized protein n=1 Tax=Dreissena polymorpha TaxID=45954 RepID=A0A9D3YQ21_DREPO|nr:hypothetical protein DPMN_079726 [Dreissena polymorpha]
MERDHVSVNIPGKNDCKNDKTGMKGDEFCAENPNTKVPKSVFCRLRPDYILLTKLITRNTCLSSKQQNFAKKLKSNRSVGIDISPNPETVSKKVSEQDMIDMLTNKIQDDTEVEFEEWKRVEVEGKKKMKIVNYKYTKEDYIKHTQLQFQDFLQHVSRVKTQYTAIQNLKLAKK